MLEGLPDKQIHYADGIRQSALLCVENVQYADGEITYTLVNEMEEMISVDSVPAVEKKINGEWKYVPMCQISDAENDSITVAKHSHKTDRFPVDAAMTDLIGEYRLIFTPDSFERWIYTDPDTDEERLVILQGVTCLVGYLTITE
jgi:hypothetical protein